jgi:hypothetical protein
MKIFVAILLIAAVVTIISGDKAKTQTYCDIQKLGGEMEQAYEKRNLKLVDELLGKKPRS